MTRASVVVYPRIRSVVADKSDGSRWEHKFTTPAAIIGKCDGSLAIKSSQGKRLHKRFDYKGKREPFLVNPPPEKNPWPEKRAWVYNRHVAPRHKKAAELGWQRRYEVGFRPKPTPRRGKQPEALRRYAEERDRRAAHSRATNEHYMSMENPVEKNIKSLPHGQHYYVSRVGGGYRQPGARDVIYLRTGKRDFIIAEKHPLSIGPWKVFPSARAHRHFKKFKLASTSGTKKNPLLQILNPPRKTTMRTGKMPPGLARYWATHRRKKRANPKRRRRVTRNAWPGESDRHRRAKKYGVAGPVYHTRRRKAATNKENPMRSNRKHRRRRAAPKGLRLTNFRRRHHGRRRRNPPGRIQFMSLGRQAAGVGVGIIAPTMLLKSPGIPPALLSSAPGRILAKLGIGWLVSQAGSKFVGREFGQMILIGTAANILMADIFPRLLPQTGVGLAEGYQDLPMLSDYAGMTHPNPMDEFPSEGMGEFPSEVSNVNEFATA